MRIRIVAAALVLGALTTASAFASQVHSPQTQALADGSKEGKHFPMPAAEFKAKVDARMTRARAHMEERAAKLPDDQAKEVRAKFEAAAKNVEAEVAKATADGTVTKDEAKAVRHAAPHGARGHHKKHRRP